MLDFALCLVLIFIATFGVAIPPPDHDGKYHIHAEGITASFIPYGASVTNLLIHDRNGISRDIVLGYDNTTAYASDPIHPSYGATIGRYANRLLNATYVLDGKRYYTDKNAGNNTIHSGSNGWSYREWTVSAFSKSSITFTLCDEANSSRGFPGLVVAKVTYGVSKLAWHIKIEAEAKDHRTPLMLTNHAYWNLDAFANPHTDTVLQHTLKMPYSKRKLGFNGDGQPDGTLPNIPQGDISDFYSDAKQIGASSHDPKWTGFCGPGVPGYDCQWIVDRSRSELKEPVASLWSDWSGIRWDMYSNQEGLVMTSCGFFPPGILPLKQTQRSSSNTGYVSASGCVAVEPQDWVAGVSFPQWGRSTKQIYGPDSGVYENDILYKFSTQQ